jgi:hypothetical protein
MDLMATSPGDFFSGVLTLSVSIGETTMCISALVAEFLWSTSGSSEDEVLTA